MSMADRGYRDSTENYCDSYVLNIAGSTGTAIQGQDYKQPIAVFGLSVEVGEALTTGDVVLLDGSATADTNPQYWRVIISSGTVSHPDHVTMFSRPLTFNTGLIVSATTVTGAINLLIKPRY